MPAENNKKNIGQFLEKLKKEKLIEEKKVKKFEILPVRVDGFDKLLEDGGFERGSTILIAGGAGTGKTTFCMQSIYYGCLNGEKGIYVSFEEDPERIKYHMYKNYGWNFYELEKQGLFAILKLNPAKIARQVEAILEKKAGLLKIDVDKFSLPFVPDRIAIDSLSALSIAFAKEENYRRYIKELFEILAEYNSVNYAIDETEQNPNVFSRSGIEEFLADGVIVFYNIREDGKRKNALEILKLRSGRHVKGLVPYRLTKKGFEVMPSLEALLAFKENY